MSKHYKLIIENKNKKIISEAIKDYNATDITKFLGDIYKLTKNTVAATVISIGAQFEHAVLTSLGWNHFDLSFINETFIKKIEEANKLYNEAIPESIKYDVEYLYAIDNPSMFVGKRLFDFVLEDKGKNLDTYVPFVSFLKRNFSGEFFKTDIKKFGEWFGGIFKLNNVVWYFGWIFNDIIGESKIFMKKALEKNLLSKTGIKSLQGINTVEELLNRYPDVALFMKAFDGFEVLTGSYRIFYRFLKRNEKRVKEMLYYTSILHYGTKNGFYLAFKRAYDIIQENQKRLDTEQLDTDTRNELQQEINELKQKYKNILNKKFGETPRDVESGYTFNQIEELNEKLDKSLIKTYTDVEDEDSTQTESITVIEELKIRAQLELKKVKSTDKNYKMFKDDFDMLKLHENFLKDKYKNEYGKEKINSDEEKNKIKEDFQALNALYEEVMKEAYTEVNPKQKLKEDLDEYFRDLKNTSAALINDQLNLIPNAIKSFTSEEFKTLLYKEIGDVNSTAWDALADIYGQTKKEVPAIDATVETVKSIWKFLQKF